MAVVIYSRKVLWYLLDMIIFELRTESSRQQIQRSDVSFQCIITESDAIVSVTPCTNRRLRETVRLDHGFVSLPRAAPALAPALQWKNSSYSNKPTGWRPERSNGRTQPTRWIRWAGGKCCEVEGSLRKGSWKQHKWKKDLNVDGFDMFGCFKLANLKLKYSFGNLFGSHKNVHYGLGLYFVNQEFLIIIQSLLQRNTRVGACSFSCTVSC